MERKHDRDRLHCSSKPLDSSRPTYHLSPAYNPDLVRRSLKTQTQANRLNIQPKRKMGLGKKGGKKLLGVMNLAHNLVRTAQLPQHAQKDTGYKGAESVDKKKEGLMVNANHFGAGLGSLNATPNSNPRISYSTSIKSKDKRERKVHKLEVKNTAVNRLRMRQASKDSIDSCASKRSQASKDSSNPHKVVHLTLNGSKNNTNVVQINNYINQEDAISRLSSDNHSSKFSGSSASNQRRDKVRTHRKKKPIPIDCDHNILKGTGLDEAGIKKKVSLMTQPMKPPVAGKSNNLLLLAQNLASKRALHL